MKSLGFVRDSYVYFVVCCSEGEEFTQEDAKAVFYYACGEEVRAPLSYFSEGELEVESWINIKKPKSYGAEGFLFFKSTIPSANEKFLASVYLELKGRKIEFYSTDFSLDKMLVTDFETFQKFFSYAKGRHVDSETVRFIARNNLKFSYFNNDVSSTVIITSFSIYCYKSLAIKNVDYEEAEVFYEQANKKIKVLDDVEASSGSIRVDVFSRELSIHTSYVQVLYFKGDFDAVKEILQVFLLKLHGDDYSRYYYNLSRCLCFYLAVLSEDESDYFSFEDFARKKLLKPLSSSFHNLPHWYVKELSEALFILSHLFRIQDKGCEPKDRFKLIEIAARVTGKEYYRVVKNHVDDFWGN